MQLVSEGVVGLSFRLVQYGLKSLNRIRNEKILLGKFLPLPITDLLIFPKGQGYMILQVSKQCEEEELSLTLIRSRNIRVYHPRKTCINRMIEHITLGSMKS